MDIIQRLLRGGPALAGAFALSMAIVGCGSAEGQGDADDADLAGEDVGEAASALTQSITIRAGLAGSIVQDTYVDETDPKASFGSQIGLFIGSTGATKREIALIRWDLNNVPPGVTINAAKATLTMTYGINVTPSIFRVIAPWTEGGATWNNFGQGYDPVAILTLPSGLAVPGQATKVYNNINLTSLVQGWVSKTYANHGIALAIPNANVYAQFWSSQIVSPVTYRPTLDVTYTTTFCTGQPNGTACNDNSLCTQTDTCVDGICVGASPVVCPGPSQCSVNACNPATGLCSVADGTACNDNNGCTQKDACKSGVCVGSNPVVCQPIDACHLAGVCSAATGTCAVGASLVADTQTGLIHRWTFDEPSGTAYDAVGTAHGTLGASAARGASFDGSNAVVITPTMATDFTAFVDFGTISDSFGPGTYTLSTWMKVPPQPILADLISYVDPTHYTFSPYNFVLYKFGPNPGLTAVSLNGPTNLYGVVNFDDGAWHHHTFVRTPMGVTQYMDGAFVAQTNLTTYYHPNANDFRLGVDKRAQLGQFNTAAAIVSFEDTRLYNRALNTCDTKTLATPSSPGTLSATADDWVKIYQNGALVLDNPANLASIVKTVNVGVAAGDQLAVEAGDTGGAYGFIAQLVWGNKTFSTNTVDWRCVGANPPAGWKNKGFNDSAWPLATLGTNVAFGDSLKQAGALMIWGSSPGGTVYCRATVKEPTLGVAQLAAGIVNTCALLTNGAVRCWGSTMWGPLGYGNLATIGDNESPSTAGDIQVGGKVVQIDANVHVCALLDNGKVRCWGANAHGQLGYGHTLNIGDDETPSTAGDVNIGGKAVRIVTGDNHTCALLDTGKVRCWGLNTYGQLGYGNTNKIGDNELPFTAGDVNVGGKVVQISAKGDQTCVLLDTGNVRCWGLSDSGQCGYGNKNSIGDTETPASAGDVNIGAPVKKVICGVRQTCAILTTGDLRCWGRGTNGRLGYGNQNDIGDNETPASAGNVPVGGKVVDVSLGHEHMCALLDTGFVRCWGEGVNGALGYGNQTQIGDDEPASTGGDINTGNYVALLSTGWRHSCVKLISGEVRCWGLNASGQLGYGNLLNIGDNENPGQVGYVKILP